MKQPDVRQDEFGREIPDPTPLSIPLRMRHVSDSQHVDMVTRIVQRELSRHAAENGHETLEESDDFEIDENDPLSAYELTDMQEENFEFEPEPEPEPETPPAPEEPEQQPSTGTQDDGT